MQPAVFLDKDGTLIHNVPYNIDPAEMMLAEGVREGAQLLHSAGFALVVVSNQSGVARGYFTESALSVMWEQLQTLLAVPLTGVFYCPHHPQGSVPAYALTCDCRKPEPGLLLRAAAAHDLDLQQSWMVGDILNDVEAGHRAGCRSILINNGNETEWTLTPTRIPELCAADFTQAVDHILKHSRHEVFSDFSIF